jgi:hypothetical protein
MKSFSLSIILFLIVTSCGFNKKGSQTSSNTVEPQETVTNMNTHVVTVLEVIQASNYSYLKLKEGGQEYWAAVPRFDAKIGQTYYYNQSMEMKDFESNELKRTFSSIWFIDGLADQPLPVQKPNPMTTTGRKKVDRVTDIKVKPAAGGITISKLMSDKSQFANKKVIISGQVVKFSPEIMNKNWVHIQDGTEASGNFDLVVTTNEVVKVGDIVTFEGTIATDKDFGYGYKYDVIMEDAKTVRGNETL